MICLDEKRVITYGNFINTHDDHLPFLHRVARLGHHLIVGLATDGLLHKQGLTAVAPYAKRRAFLERCPMVDRVIPHTHLDQARTDVVNYNVSVVAVSQHSPIPVDDLQSLAQIIHVPCDMPMDAAPLTFRQVGLRAAG